MHPGRREAAQSPRIAIATCDRFPDLTPDDALLARALGGLGIEAVPVVWNAAPVEWEAFDGCLLRSVWDYHLWHGDFLAWAGQVAAAVPLWNPLELVAWNADKRYLRELAQRGVPTIPTHWLQRGTEAVLADLLAERGWERAILKPAIDLGAKNLRRTSAGDGAGQAALEELLETHDVMVQPFLSSLETRGELSLVYLGGAFSHAVRKRAKEGDFRVQANWGGSSSPARPDGADLEVARTALDSLEEMPLYARVDLVEGAAGERYLIELELIDPNLFFGEHPAEAGTLAAALAASLR